MNFEKLHHLFERIKKEWKEDSHVEHEFRNKQYTTDLGKISMEIPFLHNKYLNHYTDLSQVKTSLEFELRKTLKEKRE